MWLIDTDMTQNGAQNCNLYGWLNMYNGRSAVNVIYAKHCPSFRLIIVWRVNFITSQLIFRYCECAIFNRVRTVLFPRWIMLIIHYIIIRVLILSQTHPRTRTYHKLQGTVNIYCCRTTSNISNRSLCWVVLVQHLKYIYMLWSYREWINVDFVLLK